jgi:hypothetical protein
MRVVTAENPKGIYVTIGNPMSTNLTGHQVAELIGVPYKSFRKNSLTRRPRRQPDGTYVYADVVAWHQEKLTRKDACMASKVDLLVAEMERLVSLRKENNVLLEKFRVLAASSLVYMVPCLPRMGMRPESWFGPVSRTA